MLNNLIKKLSSFPITFESWILSALGIIAVRIFLEQYSNNLAGHYVLIDLATLVQYTTSFLTILLCSIAIILYSTKKSLQEVASLTLFAFMLIWTAPIFDLILSAGKGYNIHYLFLNLKELLLAFVTEFWTTTSHGMTYGIRLEILLILIISFITIYILTKSKVRALVGSILLWLSIFIIDCLPSFLGIFQTKSTALFIQQSVFSSNIINNSIFSMQSGIQRLYDIGFNSLISQSIIVIAFVALSLICFWGYREKAKILFKNARWNRIAHYVLLVVAGVIVGGGKSFFHSWVNILSLIMTMSAFALAWFSAVCVNDIHDIDIDVISNKDRPLPSGSFTKAEFLSLARISLLLALLAAYSASLYGLFFVILFSFAFYIYSANPIKLKQHFVSGALVIGFASVSAILSGFFLAHQSRELFSFPPLFVLALIILFGFSSMIKDIKDYEGDRANGIKTLPVVLGLRASKIVIAVIVSLSLIGISIYIHNLAIVWASIITSICIWIVLLSKNYKEKRFFIVYLAYLVFCGVIILIK